MADVKAIAFYLPQYHPIPENDLWWGKGFTEWTNVARGVPYFPDHYQPHRPSELGYYDLRVPEVRAEQAALARRYGLHGFCYYYYWFSGRRLLERPLDAVLASGQPEFPFCICWANENWTRRWDGAEQEILMKQEHSPDSDERFIHDVLPILKDPRYIRVDGAPLLLVYRPAIIPDPRGTTAIWRRVAAAEGVQLHLCAVQSFGLDEPRPLGFDSACEFPPHGISATEITPTVEGLSKDFTGKVFDYRDIVAASLRKAPVDYPRYRGVMTAWDNTARRGPRGHIYAYSSPRDYEVWLRAAVAEVEESQPPGRRFVFINAWNEWAEGTHLEPDQKFGHAYLEATGAALNARTNWRETVKLIREHKDLSVATLRGLLRDLEFALEAQDRSLRYLAGTAHVTERLAMEQRVAVFSAEVPPPLRRGADMSGLITVDRVQGMPVPSTWTIDRAARVAIEGWAFSPKVPANGATKGWLVLRSRQDKRRSYFAPLFHREPREDVVAHFPRIDRRFTARAGFTALLWCEEVPAGEYDVGVIHADDSKVAAGFWNQPVTVK